MILVNGSPIYNGFIFKIQIDLFILIEHFKQIPLPGIGTLVACIASIIHQNKQNRPRPGSIIYKVLYFVCDMDQFNADIPLRHSCIGMEPLYPSVVMLFKTHQGICLIRCADYNKPGAAGAIPES